MAGKCIEPVVKVVAGLTWFAFAAAGMVTSAAWLNPAILLAVGGAGCAAAVTEGFRKNGIDSTALLEAIRKATLARLETQYGTLAEHYVLKDADAALVEYLPQCLLDCQELELAARDCSGFPARATAVMMAKLAELAPGVFGENAPPQGRDFAACVVATALDVTVTTPAYFAQLQPTFDVTQLRMLAELIESTDRIEAKVDSVKEDTAAIRSDTAELKEGQQTTNELLRQLLASGGVARAEASGLSEKQIVQLLEGYVFKGIAADQVEMLLLKASVELKGLCERLSRLSEDEPEIAAKRQQAKDAIDVADFAKADKILAEAEELDLTATRLLQEKLELRTRRAAETMAERGSLAFSQAKFEDAATHFGRAAETIAPYDAERAWNWHFAQAGALYGHGNTIPGLDSLRRAVAIYRGKCLPLTLRETRAVDWALIQNDLGNALSSLGERAGGEEGLNALNDGAAAYRAALKVLTIKVMPVEWAITQDNLGIVLSDLGKRAGGEEGLNALNDAVSAHRAALQVHTREAMPADWAKSQNNLGAALASLGDRAAGEEGLKALHDAVAAFRAVLQVHTRETVPADWARAQNNLGAALQNLGARAGGEEGQKTLNESVAASRAALEVITRYALPLVWAMCQNNLGNALSSLGERAGGAEGLQALTDAAAAYRAALEVRARETMPAQWVFTTENLAIVEAKIARTTRDPVLLRQAAARMNEVIAVYRTMQAGNHIENAKRNQAWMRFVLAKLDPPPNP